jgi:hypothetical protein
MPLKVDAQRDLRPKETSLFLLEVPPRGREEF